MLSVIVPVFNEAEKINNFINQLQKVLSPEKTEYIIVDGDKTHSTIKNINQKSIRTIYSERGRGVQMNAGAKTANGDILLFLHADTILPENTYQLIISALNNKECVAGAFNLALDNPRFIFRLIEIIVKYRTKVTRVPFGDQALFFKKEYFNKIGGYQNIPFLEDVEIMKRVRKRSDKITIISEKVLSSTRKWDSDGVCYTTFRNTLVQILYFLGVSPFKLVKLYY